MLTMHPAVYDVAVFGVPDAEMGEEVKAVVQPAVTADAGPELEAELIEFCQSKARVVTSARAASTSTKRCPARDSGKLYKRRLRDRYWAAQPGTAGS